MELADFNYPLPKHLIAQELARPRDSCRLMVVKDTIEHRRFTDLPSHLQKGDVLVVNQTKVQHAKLIGKKSTGAKVELILTKPLGNNQYECHIKGTNVRPNTKLVFPSTTAIVTSKTNDLFTIHFDSAPSKDDLILPTPPYIKRPIPENDYQTIFAHTEGSLAAPTAALHFTPELVEKIKKRGITFAQVTLHIGFGTFLPVHDLTNPKTEPEFFEITQDAADIINTAKRIIAVGTTSVKALESAAKPDGQIALTRGFSDIFIRPGYRFKTNISAMVTNFHLPKSSLLMLVCAFGGTERVLAAYQEAVKNHYDFYSLGDAMLIF